MLNIFTELEEIIECQQKTIGLQQETIKKLSTENINLKQIVDQLIQPIENDNLGA